MREKHEAIHFMVESSYSLLLTQGSLSWTALNPKGFVGRLWTFMNLDENFILLSFN